MYVIQYICHGSSGGGGVVVALWVVVPHGLGSHRQYLFNCGENYLREYFCVGICHYILGISGAPERDF